VEGTVVDVGGNGIHNGSIRHDSVGPHGFLLIPDEVLCGSLDTGGLVAHDCISDSLTGQERIR
jgi:hypothetical protein